MFSEFIVAYMCVAEQLLHIVQIPTYPTPPYEVGLPVNNRAGLGFLGLIVFFSQSFEKLVITRDFELGVTDRVFEGLGKTQVHINSEKLILKEKLK